MANSIDFTTLALGALVGVGCRKQLRSAARVAAGTAAQLAGVAANAAAQIAMETAKSPEQAAAEQFLKKVDQQIAAGQQAQPNGQNG